MDHYEIDWFLLKNHCSLGIYQYLVNVLFNNQSIFGAETHPANMSAFC